MSTEHTLQRSLGLGSVVLFGLAYMTPMIIFGTFGVLAVRTQSAVPAAYIIALGTMLFTALSYSRLANRFPVAGSAYTYSSQVLGGAIGFLVGWVVLLDYLFLPMVIWLIGAAYLADAFPLVPNWFWLSAFIVSSTLINIIGLKTAKKLNLFLMFMQVGIIIAFCILGILFLNANGLLAPDPEALRQPLLGESASLVAILGGAAIASYSFLGFDAVSTLAEETHNPRRTIPRAIILITIIGGVIFFTTSYIMQLAFPNSNFENAEAAGNMMADQIGGPAFAAVFLIGLVLAQFASGIAAQASGSRLLYVMGRDGVFPKSVFGRLHSRFKTPFVTILLTGAVGLGALKMDLTTSTSFINFGAFLAFAFVNLSVIVMHLRRSQFDVSGSVLRGLVFPLLGLASIGFLFVNLQADALRLGSIWLAIGVAYLIAITRAFTRPPPRVEFKDE